MIGESPTPFVKISIIFLASLVRERIKSYPRVVGISSSCTPHGVKLYISGTLNHVMVERVNPMQEKFEETKGVTRSRK